MEQSLALLLNLIMKHLYWFFLVIFLTACSEAAIQGKLDEIDTYVDSDPQSALAAVNELDISDVKSEKVKAHYSLLHSKAIDKCYIDTTDVSVIIDAVKYYSRHGNPDQKMQTYYYLGRIHGNAGRYTESLLALTQALEAGEASSDVKYKGRVYIAMADAHNRNYNVVEEGRCVDKALDYFEESGDSIQINAAKYRKAVSCINLRDFEQSDSLFQSLLLIKDLRPSLKAKCFVKYAYLLSVIDDSDYQRTYQLFQDAISSGAEFSKKDVAAYAYILWCKGDTVGSEKVFSDLERRDSSVVGVTSWWKSRIKKKEGLFKEAYEYLDDAMTYASEVEDNALQQSLSIAQRDYYSAIAAQQKTLADNRKKISILIAVAAIAIILLILGIILNVIRRIKEREFNALTDLEYLKDHLMDVQQSSAEKDARIESLQAKFQEVFREHFRYIAQLYETYEINRTRGYSGISTYKHIQDVFKAIKGEEETAHIFEKTIDKDMDGLITRFRADFPDLKEIDYLLFCYYVAGYDTKTISIILTEKTPNSLDAKKSRLKKMIMESDAKDKKEYLKYF